MSEMRPVIFDLQAQEELEEIQRLIARAIAGFTVGGRLNLAAGYGIAGALPPGNGGTGNTSGEAIPTDGSVTNIKVAEDADIDPAKLDQGLLLAAIYLLVRDSLVAGDNVTITPNNPAHTLTIAVADAGALSLAELTDVALTGLAEGDLLYYLSGKWRNVHGLPSEEEGALYIGGDYLTIGGDTLTVED